jgi:hypothetical protein
MTLERERWETFRRKHSSDAIVRHRPLPDTKPDAVIPRAISSANEQTLGTLDPLATRLSQPGIRAVMHPATQNTDSTIAAPAAASTINPLLTPPPPANYKLATLNPIASPTGMPATMPIPPVIATNTPPVVAPLATRTGLTPDPIALQARAHNLSQRSLWVALLAAGIGGWLFMKSGGVDITEGRQELIYWSGIIVACLLGVRPLLGKELAHQGLSGQSALIWGFVCLAWPALVASMLLWAIGQHAGGIKTLLLLIPALLILRIGLSAMMYVGTALTMRSPWPSPVSPAFSGWGSGWMWLGLIATVLLDIGLLRGASLMPSLMPTLSNLISPANDLQVAEAPVEAPTPEARRANNAQGSTRQAPHQAEQAPVASQSDTHPSLRDLAQPLEVGVGPLGTSVPRGTPSLPPAPAAAPSIPSAPPAPATLPSPPSAPRAAANTTEPSPAKPDAPATATDRAKSTQLLVEARALDKEGKTEQAVVKLEAAVQADPVNADTTMALARGQRLTNQYEKENQTLRKVIELQPTHSVALMALGDSQLRLRGTDKKTVDEAANYYVASYKNASDRKGALKALRSRAEEDGTGRSLAASRALDLIDAD